MNAPYFRDTGCNASIFVENLQTCRYDINNEGLIHFPLFSQGVVRGRTPKKKNRGESFSFDDVPDFKEADASDEEADRSELKRIMENWN